MDFWYIVMQPSYNELPLRSHYVGGLSLKQGGYMPAEVKSESGEGKKKRKVVASW